MSSELSLSFSTLLPSLDCHSNDEDHREYSCPHPGIFAAFAREHSPGLITWHFTWSDTKTLCHNLWYKKFYYSLNCAGSVPKIYSMHQCAGSWQPNISSEAILVPTNEVPGADFSEWIVVLWSIDFLGIRCKHNLWQNRLILKRKNIVVKGIHGLLIISCDWINEFLNFKQFDSLGF